MSRFLVKASGFALVQLAIFAVLVMRARSNAATDYYAASLDKHSRARAVQEPRLLVVGGSNAAFGIDSPLLEHRLGRPVVNFGLHAGVGLDFMLNEVESQVRAGDIVVITPEYEHFIADNTSPLVVFRMLEHRPESAGYLKLGNSLTLLDSGLPCIHEITRRGLRFKRGKTAQRSAIDFGNDPYHRKAFNAQGDVVAHHKMKPSYSPPESGPKLDATSGTGERRARLKRSMAVAIDRLNEFTEACRQMRVTVFLAHPPVSRSFATKMQLEIHLIDAALQERLHAPLLTTSAALVLDDGMFFDSCYHLTLAGKEIRTEGLAEALDAIMPERASPSEKRPDDGATKRMAGRHEGTRAR